MARHDLTSFHTHTHIRSCLSFVTNQVIATPIGQVLTNSLSVYGAEDNMPLLIEITGLAKTSLGVVVKAKNPSALVPILSFMQKFFHLHGSKVEPNPKNNVVYEVVQNMAKNLMLMSYAGVRNDVTQEIATPMFDTLTSLAKRCPLFLLCLSRSSQPPGEIVCSSIETAPMTLQSSEMDVVLSSIRFLNQLVSVSAVSPR